MRRDLVIVGTGGMARELHQIVEDLNSDGAAWHTLGFLDDNPDLHATGIHNLPVLGPRDWIAGRGRLAVAVGVGATAARRRLVGDLVRRNPEIFFPTLVHPLAWIGNRIAIGDGTVVCAGSSLTTDLLVGSHVILNVDCTISHDAAVGNFVTLAPGVHVAGAVRIGDGCDIGVGSAIIQGVEIGKWSVLGAGSVVTDDLPPNVTAVGAPTRQIKERPDGWHEDAT
jgi:sugar O-acyltransferase (sialic acid O-acetyltransferase NeuD family)